MISFPFLVQNRPEKITSGSLSLLRVTGAWVACVKPVGAESEKEMPLLLRERLGGDVFPVHRLDVNVGGVMVFARTKQAAAVFSRLIQEGSFQKQYLALVHGVLPPEGRMEDLLWKDPARNKVFVVQRERKGVRSAALQYRTLETPAPDQTLVEITLETGRSHQIRVQFASRGCPLWGDHKYGARDEEKYPALLSWRITFPWPGEGEIKITCPL